MFETNIEQRLRQTGVQPEGAPAILIVDDTPMNLDLMQRILSRQGFHTLVATGGHEALQVCSTTPVDLILLDVMMPERDGFRFAPTSNRTPPPATFPSSSCRLAMMWRAA